MFVIMNEWVLCCSSISFCSNLWPASQKQGFPVFSYDIRQLQVPLNNRQSLCLHCLCIIFYLHKNRSTEQSQIIYANKLAWRHMFLLDQKCNIGIDCVSKPNVIINRDIQCKYFKQQQSNMDTKMFFYLYLNILSLQN